MLTLHILDDCALHMLFVPHLAYENGFFALYVRYASGLRKPRGMPFFSLMHHFSRLCQYRSPLTIILGMHQGNSLTLLAHEPHEINMMS